MIPGVLQIRTPLVNFHVLRDGSGLCLLDTGFIGGFGSLKLVLRREGWDRYPIRGIILSHGHLDHVFNVARIVRETGAWVAAPEGDAARYAGKPVYRGWGRVTAMMEAVGRRLPGFAPFVPDRWIGDGERLDVWEGLRAVHLPGHTEGHTGYFCEGRRLLFCGDLFASFGAFTHLPPRIFNSRPEQIPASLVKALELDPAGVVPNHSDRAEPAVHRDRLQKLAAKAGREKR